MRARSAAASVVRHVSGVAAEATLVAALVAVVALAFSPLYAPARFLAGNRGADARATASISFVGPAGPATPVDWPTAGGSVSFSATATVKPSDVYKLWVANKCAKDGSLVYTEFAPVHSWVAGPFSLSWAGGGSASCTAYVFLYPNTGTPLSGGSMSYIAY